MANKVHAWPWALVWFLAVVLVAEIVVIWFEIKGHA